MKIYLLKTTNEKIWKTCRGKYKKDKKKNGEVKRQKREKDK